QSCSARSLRFPHSATASVAGKSMARPSNISTHGAIRNGSICWELPPPWSQSGDRKKACRSEYRSSRVHGRRNWFYPWQPNWKPNADHGRRQTLTSNSCSSPPPLRAFLCALFVLRFFSIRKTNGHNAFILFRLHEKTIPCCHRTSRERTASLQKLTNILMPDTKQSRRFFASRGLPGLLIFLFLSAAYLYTFPQPNVLYAVVVLLHAVAGVIASVLLAAFFFRLLRNGSIAARLGWTLLAAGAIVGLILIKTGTPRVDWNLLYAHIVLSFAGAGIVFAEWAGKRGWLAQGVSSSIVRCATCLLVLAGLGAGAHYLRDSRWQNQARIENPSMPPASMNAEGDGPDGPFFPSSAQVHGGQKIPSKFFVESDSCKRCHEDIYNQWFSSAHHFSSFNNQWYRKAIEYMQDTVGTKPSKWCGGCHDPAVLYSGLMDTPIKQIVHRPESQAGLGCMMCHSIANVKSTMGQGDFYLEYPKLHELAASKNPVVRTLHDFLIKLNPEPHRRVFLKPFMRQQTAEFCSSCHKVHLDVPVNHYRWFRGFNEYDNWQASGVSGEGARSFYYPPKPQQCADCHMPLERSNDMGNVDGKVHSHRFPGANTALPTANEDAAQLKVTEDFLTSGALTVDIFALSPASTPLRTGAVAEHALATTFAIGEEAETKITPGAAGAAAPV